MASLDDEPVIASAAASGGREKRAYVRRIFSEIAPRYDLLNHLLSANIDRRWRRAAIAALDWPRRPAGRYLDLCAGTLDVAATILREPRFEGHVVAADFAEPMLAAGRGKAPRRRLSPVTADALELPFGDACFDGAIAAFGVRNLASIETGLAEVFRVLRPAATFVILDFTTPRSPVVRAMYRAYFHHVLPRIGGWISGHPTAYRYLPESVDHFAGEAVLAERLRGAGFDSVRWQSLTFGIAAIHAGRKPPAARDAGRPLAEAAIG